MDAAALREALEGAPLPDRSGESKVFEYAHTILKLIDNVDNPVFALEAIRSVEMVEKAQLPTYCYQDVFTSDYRAEVPWHVARMCLESLARLYTRFRYDTYAPILRSELNALYTRRFVNFEQGGMEPVRKVERLLGFRLEKEG